MGKKALSKKSKVIEKNTFSDLFSGINLGNVLDTELKQSLQNLKDELEFTKIEKEKLIRELDTRKEEIKRKDTEIDLLKNSSVHKINFDFSGSGDKDKTLDGDDSTKSSSFLTEEERQKYQNEIRKLRNEVNDKEGNLDILNLKIDELIKSNRDLTLINEDLSEQLIKRKDKFDSEMNSLYGQIRDLEMKKTLNNNLSQSSANLIVNNNNNLDSNVIDDAKKQISDAKQENIKIVKKYEDLKAKYEKELSNLKNEINNKDKKLDELESQISKKEKMLGHLNKQNSDLTKEIFDYKTEVENVNLKYNNMVHSSNINKENIEGYENEMNKLKKENENNLRKKDRELNDLKDALETIKSTHDRLKKMEAALKNELAAKDNELTKRQEILKDMHKENEKISDNNVLLKKENYNLQSKLQLMEMEYKNKYELELQIKSQELKNLKENVIKYENNIRDLKDSINRKREIIENKKQMNIILCDLAKIKKAEVQCLETLQYANTENLRKTLEKIRSNEKDLLEK